MPSDREVSAFDAGSEILAAFEDLTHCRHVLAVEHAAGWSALNYPTGQLGDGAAQIDLDLARLVMATAEV